MEKNNAFWSVFRFCGSTKKSHFRCDS